MLLLIVSLIDDKALVVLFAQLPPLPRVPIAPSHLMLRSSHLLYLLHFEIHDLTCSNMINYMY